MTSPPQPWPRWWECPGVFSSASSAAASFSSAASLSARERRTRGGKDPWPDETQECWGEGERDEYRDEHGGCGGESHGREEGYAGEGERAERDDDGQSGEEDSAACGPGGPGDRFDEFGAAGELFSVSVDEEEGVVDTDGKSEHECQGRGDVGHVDPMGECDDPE